MTGHVYLSTACHHTLHDRCRQACKFCEAPCHCACHDRERHESFIVGHGVPHPGPIGASSSGA